MSDDFLPYGKALADAIADALEDPQVTSTAFYTLPRPRFWHRLFPAHPTLDFFSPRHMGKSDAWKVRKIYVNWRGEFVRAEDMKL